MKSTLFPRTLYLAGTDVTAMRVQIREYFQATFDRYENLFETLVSDEAWLQKSILLRHPLIFYYGHTATFFLNKLVLAGLIKQRIHLKFESMFAVGVDEMSWDDLNDASYDWPSPSEVKEYRDQVRAAVLNLIDTLPLTLPIDWDSDWWPIVMGIEHERIHLETSSVLIRQQSLALLKSHPDWRPCQKTGAAPQNTLINIPAGSVTLGKDKSDAYYGWDNEYGRHIADVPAFQAAQFLVSNGEFLAFVEAGGYLSDEGWEQEGLDWKHFSHARHPIFWSHEGESWRLRLMTEEVAMPWDWPVEVNYHEAKAFCNWKSKQTGQQIRLPSEDEWYRLYELSGVKEIGSEKASANIHLDYWASSCPVNTFQHGEFFDVVGNVWQWTETPICPFEGFEVHPLYDDFTAPTFDGRHNLMKGGSWASCGNEAIKSARYAFRRHFFQHAGFRYVVADAPAVVAASSYETDKLLAEYAEFHYGDTYFGVANFPQTLAQLAIAAMGNKPARRALDLGCATGRATFELARHFDQVAGVDFSARFIGLGTQLAEQGVMRYTLTDEGELKSYHERSLAKLGLVAVQGKVEFSQGDACNLKPQLTGYDFILAANLIDRLYSPVKFLTAIHERLNLGGLLMITSPYTWLEEHTRREEWIGAYKKDGENFTTLDGLKLLLASHFRLTQQPIEVPFVIRETKRKYQHTLAEVSIWERIS